MTPPRRQNDAVRSDSRTSARRRPRARPHPSRGGTEMRDNGFDGLCASSQRRRRTPCSILNAFIGYPRGRLKHRRDPRATTPRRPSRPVHPRRNRTRTTRYRPVPTARPRADFSPTPTGPICLSLGNRRNPGTQTRGPTGRMNRRMRRAGYHHVCRILRAEQTAL